MLIKNKNLVKVTEADIVNGELVIPSGVETIDPFAMSNLPVKKIVFPKSLKFIGKYAFSGCAELKSIKIPDNVVSIDEFAFINCFNLSKVELSENLEKLGGWLFKNCLELKSVEIPNSVKELGDGLFVSCSKLKKVTLPENLEQIPSEFFKDCKNLKDIVLPERLLEINENAFFGCKLLKEIEIPNSVKKVKEGAFKECSELKNVILPENLEEIDNETFYNCVSLKEIKIPESVKTLKEGCFENCVNLKYIIIPDSVKKIDIRAFSNCSSIEFVNLSKNLEILSDDAFSDCRKLKEIEIPSKVSILGRHLFKNCYSLRSVKFPENLKIIANSSFENCYNIRQLDFPKSLESIGKYAFSKCSSLKDIVLHENLETLGQESFYGCADLRSVVINGKIKNLENSTFSMCDNLKVVVLPETLEKIGEAVFLNCENLEDIELPKNLNTIKSCAFEGCKMLSKILIPDNVKILEEGLFTNCENLKQITLSKNLERIEDDVFYNCKSLRKLELPETIKNIENEVFSGCDELQELSIPENFEQVGNIYKGVFFNISKKDSRFIFSRYDKENSVSLSEVKFPIKILMANWDNRELLLKEQSNLYVNDFYRTLVKDLSKEESKEFVNSHNFTFFKQLNYDIFGSGKTEIYKGLYNLGAFIKPIELNGKHINYGQKVVGFLQEKLRKELVTPDELINIFKKMELGGFKKDFTDFFIASFDELLEVDKHNYNFISNCYNNFEEVQKTNTSHRGNQRQLKPTIEKFIEYFKENKFKNVTEETKNIAITLSPYYSAQETFDDAVKIDRVRRINQVPDHILSTPLAEKDIFLTENDYISKIDELRKQTLEELTQIASNEFSFEWLSKNDPQNFILGKLCNCCSHLAGVGYSIMNASIIHPSVQNLVIRNDNGEIIAKSTLFVNRREGYGVLNNIEVNNSVHYSRNKIIYEKIILALNEFAEMYNKEHPTKPLTKINVGMDNNDLEEIIKRYNKHSKTILVSLNYEDFGKGKDPYYGDSLLNQYTLWEDKEKC